MRTLLVVACLCAGPALAQSSIFPSEAERANARQLAPEKVSAEARALLRSKMKSHNRELRDLSMAVVTLQFAEAARLAQLVANQPRLDRSAGPAAQLPPRFFELQDELKVNAQSLADTAKQGALEPTEAAYQKVVGTCVSCHAVFKR